MRDHSKYKLQKAAYWKRKKAAGVVYPSEAKRRMARMVVCLACDSVSFLSKKSKYCGPVCRANNKRVLRLLVERTDEFKRKARARRIAEGRCVQRLREKAYRDRAKETGRWKQLLKRRRAMPANRLRKAISRAVRKYVGRGSGSPRTEALSGCSMESLVRHIESTFSKGMTWNNYGTVWHIDHVIPCASWDMKDERQRAIAFHWTNLQALRAEDNLRKSDNITQPQMSLLIPA